MILYSPFSFGIKCKKVLFGKSYVKQYEHLGEWVFISAKLLPFILLRIHFYFHTGGQFVPISIGREKRRKDSDTFSMTIPISKSIREFQGEFRPEFKRTVSTLLNNLFALNDLNSSIAKKRWYKSYTKLDTQVFPVKETHFSLLPLQKKSFPAVVFSLSSSIHGNFQASLVTFETFVQGKEREKIDLLLKKPNTHL